VRAADDLARTNVDQLRVREEKDLIELAYRTFLACASTVEFLRARRAWEKDKRPAAMERMRQIARQERENAAAAIPIYAGSRWLDAALRLDGRFHPAKDMLREKIAWLDRFLSLQGTPSVAFRGSGERSALPGTARRPFPTESLPVLAVKADRSPGPEPQPPSTADACYMPTPFRPGEASASAASR